MARHPAGRRHLLEGQTRREAAAQLGWAEGTVVGRLARGRALLAKRVLRGTQTLTGVLAGQAVQAALSPELVRTTIRAATSGAPSAAVVALAEGVMQTLRWNKLKIGALLLIATLVLAGAGGLGFHALAGGDPLVANALPLKDEKPRAAKWKTHALGDGHEAIVMAVALSPDGKLAVSGSDDQTLRFWNTADGKQVRKIAMDPFVGGIRFAPDGKTVATMAKDSVQFRNPATGKETNEHFAAQLPGYGLAYSSDGSQLAATSDRGVLVWDVRTGKKLTNVQFEKESIARAWKLAFSPDGSLLAVALHNQGGEGDGIMQVPLVRVLEVKSGKTIFSGWMSGTVNAVAFTRDGRTLIAGGMLPEGTGDDGVLLAWDLPEKKVLYKVRADKHVLFCLAVSPDGKTLVSGGNDPAIKLWDATTGVLKDKLEKHTDQVHDLVFSADGKTLASASRDKRVVIWRLEAER